MKKYKTAKEAYFTWTGLGLFDLIPVIRDLPYILRFVLAMTVVIILVVATIIGLGFLLYGWY